MAGVIGGGLAVGLGVGIGDGVGDGVGVAVGVAGSDGEASPALLVTTVWLGVGIGDNVAAVLATAAGLEVVALEQATTATIRKEIEPIRARRPVRTLSSPNR